MILAREYRTSYKVYSAWNYQQEIADLNVASAQGWQLVKGGCFHSRFVKNPDLRYRYQLDFGKIDDLPRYLETFREQGWEYVNSTYNGWHYLRKLYDPSLPEDAYEIYTDRESLREMNSRWARVALFLGILLAVCAAIYLIRMIRTPQLPVLVRLLTFGFASGVLLRGYGIMRDPDANRSRRWDSAFLTVFIVSIVIGLGGSIALETIRPDFSTEQRADAIDSPIIDNRWADFDVYYPDRYYLDLKMESAEPMTFALINAAGETVYTVTDTDFSAENMVLRLPRGEYQFSMSCVTGFRLARSIE